MAPIAVSVPRPVKASVSSGRSPTGARRTAAASFGRRTWAGGGRPHGDRNRRDRARGMGQYTRAIVRRTSSRLPKS